jgi:hypothetical protein
VRKLLRQYKQNTLVSPRGHSYGGVFVSSSEGEVLVVESRRLVDNAGKIGVLAAIVLLLTGTGAYALIVTGQDVKNGSLQSIDIKDGSLKGLDVDNGSLDGLDIEDQSLKSSDIENDSLGSGDVKDESLQGIDLKDGTIDAQDLATGTLPPSLVYFTQPMGQVFVKVNPSVEQATVATLNLPAGGYHLLGTLAVVNFGANQDYVRCGIWQGGSQLSGSTVNPDDENSVHSLTTQAFLSSNTTSVVTFRCSRDGFIVSDPYVEGIQLSASRVEGLTDQTPTP